MSGSESRSFIVSSIAASGVQTSLPRRVWSRLVPDTLAGRIMGVLFAGLMLFHLGSLWLHQVGTEALVGTGREEQLAERLVAGKRLVSEQPPEERDRAAHALSSASLDMHWTASPTVRLSAETSQRIEAVRARLAERAPELVGSGLRVGYAEEASHVTPHLLVGAIPLSDGTWLNFSAALFRPVASQHGTLLSTTAMAIGILILGVVVVRLIGRPLRALSDAADSIGGTAGAVRVPEEGPHEVRHAARAFNRMQARIDRLIADRTQALAAVSHDLRTPIARLRLRAGFVDDPDAQQSIDRDLDEMEAMIDATLAYLRGETEAELRRPVDLVATLQTLCHEATDSGARAGFEGPSQLRLICRPLAMKRAFANLIGNAIKYAGSVRVRVEDGRNEVVVRIDDSGPGIPAKHLEAVFEPFRRLETSRNRGTGGSGLGLTIARQIIEHHGGTIGLANRPPGGLTATVCLPKPGQK
ncbi:ATP-binding protein [Elioraea rosea]|uniref:ATP-binding protein n=1 Tax=Elioraea rosea TaxID=2492390 RepID=UPI0011823DDB|nr:ATP-binding protein [Elioraea rosea]